MRRLALLLAAGCTMPNPAYDQPTGHADATVADSSAATSADPTAPTSTLEPDGGMSQGSSEASTSAVSSADSTGPAVDLTTSTASTTVDETTTSSTTSLPGSEATGDACPGGCDACHVCDNGLCVPTPGAACLDPEGNDPCIGTVAQLEDNGLVASCYGYGPGSGECDPNGACKFTCVDKVLLETCASRCATDDNICVPGMPADAVKPDSFCIKNATTSKCDSECELKDGGYTHKIQRCNADGQCALYGPMQIFCQTYACELPTGCKDSCSDDDDCAAFAHCEQTYCAPD